MAFDSFDISTHTLTWSVTGRKGQLVISSIISTHTLTWSVTYGIFKVSHEMRDFNSHAHVERDLPPSVSSTWCKISTHTLTWSVTCHTIICSGHVCNFNSHAHVERDSLKEQ